MEKSNPEMTLINFALLWAKNIVKADPAKINGDTKAWQAHILRLYQSAEQVVPFVVDALGTISRNIYASGDAVCDCTGGYVALGQRMCREKCHVSNLQDLPHLAVKCNSEISYKIK